METMMETSRRLMSPSIQGCELLTCLLPACLIRELPVFDGFSYCLAIVHTNRPPFPGFAVLYVVFVPAWQH